MNTDAPNEASSSCELSMEIKRQHSYTTLARLIGEESLSPAGSSPGEAIHMKKVVQRLEEIDMESEELLENLLLMLNNDSRLEKYFRKRVEVSNASWMWERVGLMLNSHKGSGEFDAMVNSSMVSVDKGVKLGVETNDEIRMDRFKIRTLDIADVVAEEGKSGKTH